MPIELPAPGRKLLLVQGNAIGHRQSTTSGITRDTMRSQVRGGRWQRLQRGVYAAHSGEPTRETMLWAALLRAGPGATLSHQTAAERHGLTDKPSALITITVPARRHPAQVKIPGVVIHRSDAILRTRHPAMLPPCTRVEDTVLDLIQVAPTFDEAYEWICRALGRRRSTADRIRHAMEARKRMRWRAELVAALGDAEGGALSMLEYRYVHWVERPHALPAAQRQARIRHRAGNWYLDNLYEEYGLCVELDGTAAHPADEQWRDKRRDTANAVRGIVTLRFGFLDLRERRCETAAAVATVLARNGWTTPPAPCRNPACPLRPGRNPLSWPVCGQIRPKLATIMPGRWSSRGAGQAGALVKPGRRGLAGRRGWPVRVRRRCRLRGAAPR